MEKRFLLCVWSLLLSACQQPTVYIFSENLSPLQRQQLAAALSTQSLPYEYVQHKVPREFGAATLLLSSEQILVKETEQLAAIMQSLGYQPEVSYTMQANHFYSEGNIGFYLKNPTDDFTLPERLRTTHCIEDRYNDLEVAFSKQQVEFTLPSGAVVMLNWENAYGYLIIYYRDYWQSYQHSQPLVTTPFGAKPSDTYRYTARVNKPGWLNCSLQIVYMD